MRHTPDSHINRSLWPQALWLVFVVLVSTFPARPVWAQASANTGSSIVLTPADSSRMTPSFEHYAIVEDCAMHAVRMELQYWRDKRPDTLAMARWGNPYQPHTIESTKKCLAKFSVATTPVRDLLFLGRAYFIAGDDAKADSAFQRLVAANASQPLLDRAWLLQQIVSAHLNVAPMRLAGAERYLAELDRLGAPAAVSRTMAHTAMAQVGLSADSVEMQGIHARAAVRAAKEIAGDDRRQRLREDWWARLMLVDWYTRRAMYDSARIEARASFDALSGREPGWRFDAILNVTNFIGGKAPALERTWTFNNPDSATFPVAGKPTLIILSSAVCGASCYAGYAPIRRLGAKYKNSDLRMVLLTRTYGYSGDSLLSPLQEAERTRKFFLEYQKLPVTVDIVDVKYTFRDDGVRLDREPSSFDTYQLKSLMGDYLSVILIDRNGIVRIAGGLNASTERRYDNLIAEMK